MTPEQVDYLLDEWARWQREDVIRCGWPKATAFGKAIKPDPSPSRVPIDEQRAYITDIAIAHSPRRLRFIIKLHYLGHEPIDAKAHRMRMGRNRYKATLLGVQKIIALHIASAAERA